MSVSFDPKSFQELVDNHGYVIYWEQAIFCQCYEKDQPKMNCPLCQGSGYRYLPPVKTKAVTTSLSGKYELNLQGLREPGTAYLTPQLGIVMGYRDRIEFPEVTCKYSQNITVRNGKTDSTYRPMLSCNFVIHGDDIYEEHKDFEISEDKHHLVFKNHIPVDGTKLSLLYMTTPRYLVSDLLHELRSVRVNKDSKVSQNVEMPKQYLIKREEFVYGQTVNKKSEEYSYE